MKITELKKLLPPPLFEKVRLRGFAELTPPQRKAIKSGILNGENIVISSPTASGKTFAAELACLKNIIEEKRKALYVVPLKALAVEKYEEFSKIYGDLVRVAISIGDLDSSDPWLEKYDLIIVTSEKLDSLIRHGAIWLKEVKTLVLDEIHLLDDYARGPVLEILVAKLRKLVDDLQIIALSATIRNAREIAEWLDAKLVTSDFRPVKLYECIFHDSSLCYWDNGKLWKEEKIEKKYDRADLVLIEHFVRMGKQVLIFLSSRRFAEALAKKASKLVTKYLSEGEKAKLAEISDYVLNYLERPTKQCEALSECVKHGCAFHHAGVVRGQLKLIEDAFRDRILKVICCTPTLSLGVNIPSFCSIVRDLKRYDEEFGYDWIKTLEWKQYIGRSGRPGLEEYGLGIAIVHTKGEVDEILERYILGEPEAIYSKLSSQPVLRMHVLALIADLFIRNTNEIDEFFRHTFYAHQFGDLEEIRKNVLEVIEQLKNWGFIEVKKNKLLVTRIGKRVSELYIDPLSAHKMIMGMQSSEGKELSELSYLQLLCTTTEAKPLLKLRSKDVPELNSKLVEYEDLIISEIPEIWSYEYEDFLRSFKTALMFLDWIEEKTEDEILEKYNVAPGELRSRLVNMDWLLYAIRELILLLGMKERVKELTKLRLRMEHGVKEELLSLVRFRGIGRVRARILWNAMIRSSRDVKKCSYEKLASLIGPKIAKQLKEQVGERIHEERGEKLIKTQLELFDFEGS
ncbi:MAG: DEAD/DEAH box helicase [Candidatus Nanoarchaeia archaeon]|nr:DEAD/DEAH box helicase [Candidatus Haiyanarchaeum thermophilum]MCW1302918.1 DEAD/DEAH box helicase [Candidatus Haiyanarchaeum thermophilum]MCW1303597.1 DEAD/DEAH box helicase [Candidatus Haiyanarchaeum thermophilum]MCW1306279.1 DEAD/DEAH box helicase [Candidatus Haiyanarchaeum thermophilum]MCW1307484.1 DEAD/DEAH box helicase [Candidatus Haiyanarchaeum thermophilum]